MKDDPNLTAQLETIFHLAMIEYPQLEFISNEHFIKHRIVVDHNVEDITELDKIESIDLVFNRIENIKYIEYLGIKHIINSNDEHDKYKELQIKFFQVYYKIKNEEIYNNKIRNKIKKLHKLLNPTTPEKIFDGDWFGGDYENEPFRGLMEQMRVERDRAAERDINRRILNDELERIRPRNRDIKVPQYHSYLDAGFISSIFNIKND